MHEVLKTRDAIHITNFMPTNISSSASKYTNGYVLEGKECGVKPHFHCSSIVSLIVGSQEKNIYALGCTWQSDYKISNN